MESNAAGERLREAMVEAKMRPVDLARKLNVTSQRVSQIMANGAKSIEVWQRIAAALGKPVAYFIEDAPADASGLDRGQAFVTPGQYSDFARTLRQAADALEQRPNLDALPTEGLVEVPLYGRATAGPGGIGDDVPLEIRHYPRTWIPPGQENDCFLLEISGDSMTEGRIMPGDQVLVCTAMPVPDGKIAVVEVDGEIMLKRVRRKNGKVELYSDNPRFEPFEVDQARIIGRVTKNSIDL